MDGIINVLKPPGMTSFDVVSYLRGILKTRKIGHTGTLDPGAVGVLPVCIGNTTKAIEYITDKSKNYRAELTLGAATDTQDSYGKVISTNNVNVSSTQIIDAIMSFVGPYRQIPPMYSAVKIDGHRLYELARNGVTIERKPREIEIYSINIISIAGVKVLFDVECSKGTYIRTLCSDIGDRLGCFGHMSFLIRTHSGIFDISNALTLEEIKYLTEKNELNQNIFKVEEVFDDLEKLTLKSEDVRRMLNGIPIKMSFDNIKESNLIRVYDEAGCFLFIGQYANDKGDLLLKVKKRFNR